jgi:NADPH:quinone reductase-like Zn-dependent oxidoreductase
MRAWKLRQAGGPEAFELTDIPRPGPQPGHVLIQVRAFGLNRSEWFTGIGESPTVQLPRVLGIECVGTVVRAPGGELSIRTGPVWSFDQLPLAHQAMEENRANGKMVVVVE